MKARELIDLLKRVPRNADVVMHSGTGDGEEYLPIEEIVTLSADPGEELVALRCWLSPQD